MLLLLPVQVNIIVSDEKCECICAGTNGKHTETVAGLKKLAELTHGVYTHIGPTSAAFNAVSVRGITVFFLPLTIN